MRLSRAHLLIESDEKLRRAQRGAQSGDPQEKENYVRHLVRTGDHVGAARAALQDHGHRYLEAHRAYRDANTSGDHDSYDKASDHLEKTHKEYRKAVHDFREKHGIPHPEHAYYGHPAHDSYIGADSFAGMALPAHKGPEEHRDHHAAAVASAVTDDHSGPWLSHKDTKHISKAISHHHPDHDADFDVIENNPDGSINYASYNRLSKKKKAGSKAKYHNVFARRMWTTTESAIDISRTPLLIEMELAQERRAEKQRRRERRARDEIKRTRILFHNARKPARPNPPSPRYGQSGPREGRKEGHWNRRGRKPAKTAVFVSNNPHRVGAMHGVGGHVYAYEVPQSVIKRSGGLLPFDRATEVMIPGEDWKKVKFRGKSRSRETFRDEFREFSKRHDWGDYRRRFSDMEREEKIGPAQLRRDKKAQDIAGREAGRGQQRDPQEPKKKQRQRHRQHESLERGQPSQQEEAVNLTRTPLLYEGECDNRQAGKPWRTSGGPKKFAVCADGKLVRFGDPNMEIKRDSAKRRKNFRARHNCSSPGPRTKAKYWACKTWERKKTVSNVVESRKDIIAGGLADRSSPSDFDPKQLAAGIKVELEHTKSVQIAREIAMDHLKEDPAYYSKLKKIHKESRTIGVLASLLEQQPVPTDPDVRKKMKHHVGYPPPGMIRMTAYPAGKGKGLMSRGMDAEYPDTPEGRKLAKSHAWQFPSKRIKSGKKTYEV